MSQPLTSPTEETAELICPKCGAQMQFVSVVVYDDDHDRRVFECKPCLHSETSIVKVR